MQSRIEVEVTPEAGKLRNFDPSFLLLRLTLLSFPLSSETSPEFTVSCSALSARYVISLGQRNAYIRLAEHYRRPRTGLFIAYSFHSTRQSKTEEVYIHTYIYFIYIYNRKPISRCAMISSSRMRIHALPSRFAGENWKTCPFASSWMEQLSSSWSIYRRN